MDVGTLVLEMITPLLSKNPCPSNRAWPGPFRADEGHAMLYPVSCGYIAAAWFIVVGAKCEAVLLKQSLDPKLKAPLAHSSSYSSS
jgi:hypothetical protein